MNLQIVDTFREAHPLLMTFFNIGGILLMVGVCASACSILKSPEGR